MVHLQGSVGLVVALGAGGFAADAAGALASVGVHTAAVTLELAAFPDEHLDAEPRHHQRDDSNGSHQYLQIFNSQFSIFN